jgi:hypothetical protein
LRLFAGSGLRRPPPAAENLVAGPSQIANGAETIGQEEVAKPADPGDRADQVDEVLDLEAGEEGVRDRDRAMAVLEAEAQGADHRVR